jgi:hypothetical protein
MKSTHTKFKQLTYDADMSLMEQTRSDRKKAKVFKNDHLKKRYREYVPEIKAWLFADTPQKIEKMKRNLTY